MPVSASSFAPPIDGLFTTILWITGIACVLVQGLLIYALIRYRRRAGITAKYFHGNLWLEIAWAAIPAAILTWLAFASRDLWAKIRYSDKSPAGTEQVEILAQQFAWNIRYPGADGKFGRTQSDLMSDANPFGLVSDDPASRDDVVALNEIHLVEGRPVRVTLRSKDVIHSFFVPEFRFKQDAIPGSAIDVWFTPTRAGDYEIACAEFCGPAHYRMKGFLTVGTAQEHATWLKEQAEF